MEALKAADRASRVLDDAAVIPCAGPMAGALRELAIALSGTQEDSYVASVLLSCCAKLTSHPANAHAVVTQGLLPTLQVGGGERWTGAARRRWGAQGLARRHRGASSLPLAARQLAVPLASAPPAPLPASLAAPLHAPSPPRRPRPCCTPTTHAWRR